MNIAKNMEAIFVAAILVAGATTFATAAAPVATRVSAPVATVAAKADTGPMQVVTISARRLTAAEKAVL